MSVYLQQGWKEFKGCKNIEYLGQWKGNLEEKNSRFTIIQNHSNLEIYSRNRERQHSDHAQ